MLQLKQNAWKLHFFFQVQDQMFGYKNIFATFLPFWPVDLHIDMEHQCRFDKVKNNFGFDRVD